MEPIQFTTEEHEIAGAYPGGMINQLSGVGFSLRDRNDLMKVHRDQVDRIYGAAEAEMLNSRETHGEFANCRSLAEALPLVTATLKRYLLKSHPGHNLHRESFNGIRDLLASSLWDVWKNDEAERS